MPGQQAQRFDVFMCHNSEDKVAVVALAERLRQQGLNPWLDLWELRPGLDWQDALDEQIEQIVTAAVFVGSNGMGPWQAQEVKAFLREFVDRGCPVIPVLLEDAPDAPELPTFLKGKTWVDFRREVPEPFGMLKWGITGKRPEELGGRAAAVAVVEPVVTERAIASADSFEDQYLACQASDVQALRSEGTVQYSGIFVPLLRDVFVPLNLDMSANAPGFRALFEDMDAGLEISRSFSIWDFLEKAKKERTFRQLAILAWGGYGKTTLLKHVAYRLGTKQAQKEVPQEVPFLLVLRKYRELLAGENAPSLPELIETQHVKGLAGAEDLQVPDGWVKAVLRSGRALVMFDGFDEVAKAQRPAVARWLNEQTRQYGESTFMVTSRPKAYREQDAADRLVLSSSLWVQDFDQGQRADFVRRWYWCQERLANAGRETPDVKKQAADCSQDLLAQIERQGELKALAKNPLLLNMIATFHRRYQGANLPKRRVELYREICQLQLRDRPRARRLETLLTECDAQTILQRVAFEMMANKLERVERKQLLQYVGEALAEQEEALKAGDFLEPVVDVSELIVLRDEEYEFAHLSFQEYLAAAYVAGSAEREGLLYEHLKEDWWKPTVLLYAGLVNPTRLIREAMVAGANDLAYDCLQETRKRIDSELKASVQASRMQGVADEVEELERVAGPVQDARYANLERYLKNGEWQKADDETYRLMLTEVGKDEGQWLTPEELRNFPCEPLKAIDGLWVRHSGGQFGFSVQKEMYIECGGVPDGRYDSGAFNKLCEANGWKVKGEWVKVNFDTSSPKGHLPRKLKLYLISSLASRLVNCSL